MDWSGCKWVESVPNRMGGVPVLKNTRVDAEGLLLNFDDGMSVEELVDEFGVDEQALRNALEFAGRLREPSIA